MAMCSGLDLDSPVAAGGPDDLLDQKINQRGYASDRLVFDAR